MSLTAEAAKAISEVRSLVVVLEIGASHTRVGSAREAHPRRTVRTPPVVSQALFGDAVTCLPATARAPPDLVRFLKGVFFSELVADPSDRPVVVVEGATSTPPRARSFIADALLRCLRVPSLSFAQFEPAVAVVATSLAASSSPSLSPVTSPAPQPQSAASLAQSAPPPAHMGTALVVDVGLRHCDVVPVVDGIALVGAAKSSSTGLRAASVALAELVAGPPSDSAAGGLGDEQLREWDDCVSRYLVASAAQPSLERLLDVPSGAPGGKADIPRAARLPTGPADEVVQAAADVVREALERCPLDVRRVLARRVCVVGGGSCLPGFDAALARAVQSAAASEGCRRWNGTRMPLPWLSSGDGTTSMQSSSSPREVRSLVVVLEIGASHTRVGSAREAHPRRTVRTPPVVSQALFGDAVTCLPATARAPPDLVRFLKGVFFSELVADPSDRPVVVVEGATSTPPRARSFIADALLRCLRVPSLSFAQFEPAVAVVATSLAASSSPSLSPVTSPAPQPQSAASLAQSAPPPAHMGTALVVDVGLRHCDVVPVVDGIALVGAAKSSSTGLRAASVALAELVAGPPSDSAAGGLGDEQLREWDDCVSRYLVASAAQPSLERLLDVPSGAPGGKADIPRAARLPTGPADEVVQAAADVVREALERCPLDVRRVLARRVCVVGGGSRLRPPRAPQWLASVRLAFVATPFARGNAAWSCAAAAALAGMYAQSSPALTLASLEASGGVVPDWSSLVTRTHSP
eukprot:m51a1_g10042 hypothetical protein (752) ;mRNA; r:24074-26576